MTPAQVAGLHNNIILPRDGDVGYDLVAAEEPKVVGNRIDTNPELYSKIDYIEYNTGVKVKSPEGFFSIIAPRSSISKYNLFLANSVGVIDVSYTGDLLLRFRYLFQPSDLQFLNDRLYISLDRGKIYAKGDRVGQLIFMKEARPQIEDVLFLDETKRGGGGFGSTGKSCMDKIWEKCQEKGFDPYQRIGLKTPPFREA